jgi:hypothetical protein
MEYTITDLYILLEPIIPNVVDYSDLLNRIIELQILTLTFLIIWFALTIFRR